MKFVYGRSKYLTGGDLYIEMEEKLAEQLRQLTGREVSTVVDPTLLLKAADYEKIMTTESKLPDGKLPTEEKYVFAYFVVEEKAVEE